MTTFKNKILTESLADSLVNIEDKRRSNLFTWRGQFSPQLIEQLLISYGSKKSVVFDPFLGSGTVLYECGLLGLKAAGCEINPAAVSFSKIYELINEPKEKIIVVIDSIEKKLSKLTSKLYLYTDNAAFEEDIIAEYKSCKCDIEKKVLFALVVGMDFEVKKINIERVDSVWRTLRNNIENLPYSTAKISCYQADCRKTPLHSNTVDLVITSPPYINVFNYHQNYRKSVEKTGANILSVAKSEIGANRKFRQNRFLTVVQYCMDMSEVFLELKRLCKDTAKLLFIVGRESNVRHTAYRNADLIVSVAKLCGFTLIGQQPRTFMNKYGNLIFEEILRFSPNKDSNFDILTLDFARQVGILALKNSLNYCDADVVSEINDAILKSAKIESSPLLNTTGQL